LTRDHHAVEYGVVPEADVLRRLDAIAERWVR
jgi:hypothetical protein